MSPKLDRELLFWKAVKAGVRKEELNEEWDLEDLETFNAMLDWERDCDAAVHHCVRDEFKKD